MTAERDRVQTAITRAVDLNGAMIQAMGINPDVYREVGVNALVMQPGLAKCSPASVGRAVVRCIQTGLLPNGIEAAIVPFGNEATFVPMIEGRLKLARRATPGIAFRVRLVYAEDVFEHTEGLHPRLEHTPALDGSRSDGSIIAAYAVATFPGGGQEFEVFTRADIDRYRSYARSKGGPWQTHFGEQAKKAVLGQLLKRLPRSGMKTPIASTVEAPDVDGLDATPAEAVIIDGQVSTVEAPGVDGLDATPADPEETPDSLLPRAAAPAF